MDGIVCSGDEIEWLASVNTQRPRFQNPRNSPVAQLVKNLPPVQETRVPSLGWVNLLEKEMETHSSILAWKIPQRGEPSGPQSMGSQELDTT